MKKTFLSLIAVVALFVSGCSTTSTTNTATEQMLVTDIAAGATIGVLQKNPKDAPLFLAGASILQSIASGNGQLTVTQIQPILQAAGQTNNEMAFIEPMVINLVNAYSQGGTTNGVVLNGTVQNVLEWTATGLIQGAQTVPQ